MNVKDAHGRTPLITAIWWDIPKKGVQLVGKVGIDVNIGDSWNKTPLMRAAAKGRLELVQAIINAPGVDIARIGMPRNLGSRQFVISLRRREDPRGLRWMLPLQVIPTLFPPNQPQ